MEKRKCIICGKEFEVKKCIIKKGRGNFCSRQCNVENQKRSAREDRSCVICGKSFSVRKKLKKKTCSDECLHKYKTSDLMQQKRIKKMKESCLNKFGVDSYSKLPEFMIKVKKTKKEKYGDENYNNKQQNKITCLKKYGNATYNNMEQNKKTKLLIYGNENYNNREKWKKTMLNSYGTLLPPNTEKALYDRLQNNTFGFNSPQFQDYLLKNNVKNVSQLKSVKAAVSLKSRKKFFDLLFSDKFNKICKPLFTFDEYTGVEYYKKYKFKCIKCDTEFEDYLNNGKIPRCLTCYPILAGKSRGEKEVVEYIKQLLPQTEIIENDRKVLNGKELDIYIPEKKVAIEYNGLYWHSDLGGGKDKKYHIDKLNECNSKGIKLIHIFENEWITRQDIVKSIIRTILSPELNIKLFARKCEIKEISAKISNNFLEENHLQGRDKGSVRLGLYNTGELVSVMTFSKSRFNKNIEWEISRYSVKLGYNIIGGAEKLFKHFIDNYNPKSIITYSDKRYFEGDIYKKLGFTFIEATVPNYYYTDYINVYNRINFQKHKLKNKLKIFEQTLSEWDNMKLNYWDRIWDCGNNKFIWQI